MSIQDEYERMLLLYDEFLVDKLTFVFYNPNPEQHDLFKYVQEIKPNGYIRMFNFYRSGLTHLYNILYEDIYKTKEPVTKKDG
ncbi:16576_t:CDS:2, partial [Gigaspora margarita]